MNEQAEASSDDNGLQERRSVYKNGSIKKVTVVLPCVIRPVAGRFVLQANLSNNTETTDLTGFHCLYLANSSFIDRVKVSLEQQRA